jgi:phosphatidylglycerophosphate synthase
MVAAMTSATESRRPLKSRQRAWAVALASALIRARINPNGISVASIGIAALAALSLWGTSRVGESWVPALWLIAVVGIQLRLLCNLLDGMVAVEGGRGSKSGEVFNDAPDRLADAIVLVAAGYALPWPAWGSALGWTAALLAVLTAYVRILGRSLGLPQDFRGPMAKQHRMAVLSLACLGSIIENAAFESKGWMLGLGLAVIAVGSALTIARRLGRIIRALESS